MKNSRIRIIITLFVLLSLIPAAVFSYGDNDGKRAKGPPKEAIEACEGKRVGDSVEFTGRRGETILATCEERNDQLVAVPEGRRNRRVGD